MKWETKVSEAVEKNEKAVEILYEIKELVEKGGSTTGLEQYLEDLYEIYGVEL